MIEIQNVTVYKCEHCDYTGTLKGIMNAHENECLSKQLKTAKNKDKQEIYNILDTDIINIKIKDFLKKYNLHYTTDIEYIKITIDNSFLPGFELDQSVRGIFDRTKFRLYNELSNLRYSKEYLNFNDYSLNYKLKEIDDYINLKQIEIKALCDKKAELIFNEVVYYLKGK